MTRELSEYELADDYPVYAGYLYVVDGKVIESDVQGDVARLKSDLRQHYKMKAESVKNCDIFGRRAAAGEK